MFRAVLGLLRHDVERQLDWAKRETQRQTRAVAMMAAFSVAGAIFAIGTVIIGLMALYTWAEMRWDPLTAFGVVGATTAVISALLFSIAFMRGRATPAQRPAVRSADPVALKAAVSQDLSETSTAVVDSLRRTSLGPAIVAGEDALRRGEELFKKGDQIVRVASTHMRGGSRSSLLATLGVAAVIGLIVGRRM